jgi:hypothetical protein
MSKSESAGLVNKFNTTHGILGNFSLHLIHARLVRNCHRRRNRACSPLISTGVGVTGLRRQWIAFEPWLAESHVAVQCSLSMRL